MSASAGAAAKVAPLPQVGASHVARRTTDAAPARAAPHSRPLPKLLARAGVSGAKNPSKQK
jgi:hypothetical protein